MKSKLLLLVLLIVALVAVTTACSKSPAATTVSKGTQGPPTTTSPDKAPDTTPAPSSTTTAPDVTTAAVTTAGSAKVDEFGYPLFDESYTLDISDSASIYGLENHHESHEYRYTFVFGYSNSIICEDIYMNEGIYKWVITISDGTTERRFEDIQTFTYYPEDDIPFIFRADLGDFEPITESPIPDYTITLAIYSEFDMEYYLKTVIEGYQGVTADLSEYYQVLPGSISEIIATGLTPWDDGAPENLLDGDKESTKIGGASESQVSVSFKTDTAYNIVGYELVTGGDTKSYASRNPIGWRLLASTDGSNWDIIDDKSEESLPAQNSFAMGYLLEEAGEYQYFKIVFDTTDAFQMNELILYYGE